MSKNATDKKTSKDVPRRGQFQPGNPGGPGRPRGVPNKFTTLKDAFLNVLRDLGGERYIRKFARRNPGQFLSLIARILPTSSDVEVSCASMMTDQERAERLREIFSRVGLRIVSASEEEASPITAKEPLVSADQQGA